MKICVVADYFEKDLRGGAEMSLEALIETSPYEVIKVNSKKLTPHFIGQNKNNFWIFGNYSTLNLSLLHFAPNLKYSVIEFDYKFCQLRLPALHTCDCPASSYGKRIFKFLSGSSVVWFMSTPQQQIHLSHCPDLKSIVLSAPFRESEILLLKEIRNNNNIRKGWGGLEAGAWQKGFGNVMQWGKYNNTDIVRIKNLTHKQVLEKLGTIQGLVYLPNGDDTCPRLVTEAKLAGCKLHLNNHVQQKDEAWFNSSINDIESYLLQRPKLFWDKITEIINGYQATSP